MIRNSVHEYERAFEGFLRARRVPCVGVDEARKALLPEHGWNEGHVGDGSGMLERRPLALKSFDFVAYTRPHNLLIDVKGRSAGRLSNVGGNAFGAAPGCRRLRVAQPRLESWVTLDDVASLAHWESLFGEGFRAAFAFVYPLFEQPPDGLFQEITFHATDRHRVSRSGGGTGGGSGGSGVSGGWFALLVVPLRAFRERMRPRSAKWQTFDLDGTDLQRLAMPMGGDTLREACLRVG